MSSGLICSESKARWGEGNSVSGSERWRGMSRRGFGFFTNSQV